MTDITAEAGAAVRHLGVGDDIYGTTLNTYVSPTATETVGQALAERLGQTPLDRVAVWDSSDDAVLAHAVAHAAGATVLRVADEAGVASMTPAIVAGERIVLLATAWEHRWLAALLGLVRGAGAEVAAVAAVLDSSALRDTGPVPVVNLLAALDTVEGSL